ncbi:hypothetical protein [Vibrio cholerae]|uniref:hypothetical protein n=1 Tax=Vibrio cholerae TaxID=666 RepID=UPI000E0BE8FA|nr:hypothetical protein [Vibrio cholerae]
MINLNNLFSKPEMEHVQNIPSSIQPESFRKHTSYDDDDDDLTPEQWEDHCFEVYAQEYHSLPPEERDEFMRSQDMFWMMQ